MELSARKRKILGLLVERYIKTAEPVSSAEIKAQYGEEISSATIRSELASLEELGYLVQPHVSAGRIPTEIAYKLYVENVLAGEKKEIQVAGVRDYLGKKIVEIEDVVRNTARVISDATNYTSVIVIKNTDDIRIREVKIVEVDAGKALVVIITDSGVIKDNIIEIPVNMGNGYIVAANTVVNDLFADKTLKDIKSYLSILIETKSEDNDAFRRMLAKHFINYVIVYPTKIIISLRGFAPNLHDLPPTPDFDNIDKCLISSDKRRKVKNENGGSPILKKTRTNRVLFFVICYFFIPSKLELQNTLHLMHMAHSLNKQFRY